MASKGMTLNAVIKLTATQFNAGVKQVQRSLNSLKSTFLQVAGALGAGLGFGSLISEIKNTATQLSIAKATLENVADSGNNYGEKLGAGLKDVRKASLEYAENMAFLKKISNQYGQSLLGLAQSFAKFRSAAGLAGVELNEIKKIYEALTKAAGAYHLTQEQTANAMLAVEQMFSKGKVTSEELRRQLGNALPGAFGLMAKAAKMSTGEFEKAMKAGQIIAKDVLPAFADELNKITEGANFDSLQSSLNRLSNAWVDFTEKTNFEKSFKGIVDFSSKALKTIGDNIKGITRIIASLFAGIAGGKAFRKLEKEGTKAFEGLRKASQNEIAALTKENDKLVESLDNISKQYDKVSKKLDKELGSATPDPKKVRQYSNELNRLERGYASVDSKIGKNLEKIDTLTKKTTKSTTALGKALMGIQSVGVKAFGALKAAINSIIFAAIITALVEIGSKLWEIITFSSKLEKETKKINEEVNKVSDDVTTQINDVRTLEKVVNNTALAEEKRKKALDELNEKLGLYGKDQLTVKSTAEEINKAIEKWSKNITKASRRMALLNKITELEGENLDIRQEIKDRRDKVKNGTIAPAIQQRAINRLQERLNRNIALINDYTAIADDLTKELYTDLQSPDSGSTTGGNPKLDDLKKKLDDYKEKIKELRNQRENGAISAEELFVEEGKLNEKTWKEIASFDNLEGKLKSLGKGYVDLSHTIQMSSIDYSITKGIEKDIDEADKAISKEIEDMISKMEAVQKKYEDIVGEPLPEKKNRDTFFDYKKEDYEIFDEEADNAEEFKQKLESLRAALVQLKNEAGEYWSNEMETYLDGIIQKLKKATDEAKNLRDKANLAGLTNDIKQMKKELQGATFKGIKEYADAFHSLAESVMNVGKAFAELTDTDDEWLDNEAFKKLKAFISILDELTQMYNTVTSVMKMVAETEEKRAQLAKAGAEAEKIQLGEKVALKETEKVIEEESGAAVAGAEKVKQVAMQETMAVEDDSVGHTISAESTKQTELQATTGKQAEKTIVGGMSSVADIPYVGPILAAAAAATLTALIMSAMSKFANGGVVGGNSYSGDKNVARVNSGEMILNKAQQGRLWGMLSGREGNGVGSNVQFKIRGTDLIGVMNNEMSRRRG